MAEISTDRMLESSPEVGNKVAPIAWGLSFIWMGVCSVANLGWGAAFLGLGVVTLGGQATRKYFGLQAEWFWVLVGSVLLVWGLLELLAEFGHVSIPGGTLAIVSIVGGIVLVVSALLRRR